ncbi:MAG: tetratricopeptide repeat protein [Minwuia sp.]|nr:tetratricopeptide repeat protein [Minwuia sp.]
MKSSVRHILPILLPLLACAVAVPASAAFLEGVAAYNRGDHAAAAKIWREDASEGDPAAQRNLGLLYLNGQGVPQDAAAAAAWFRRSADQGLPRAAANLGDLYLRGIGVPRDPERAVTFFRQAAEAGLAEAQHNLGVLIESGFGVEQNIDQARTWYQRAAAGGHGPARERLTRLAPRDAAAPVDVSDDALVDDEGGDPVVREMTSGVPAGDGGLIDALHAILTPAS